MNTAYALYTPDGHWYASVPNKELRDEVCERYTDREGSELTAQAISQAEYADHATLISGGNS